MFSSTLTWLVYHPGNLNRHITFLDQLKEQEIEVLNVIKRVNIKYYVMTTRCVLRFPFYLSKCFMNLYLNKSIEFPIDYI